MQRPYVSHHLQARQFLLSYLHGKETTERNLEAKPASDSVRAEQALRHAASCTSGPSGLQTSLPGSG